MKQVLYSKYNRTRKAQFQIGTQIYCENGKKYVEKYALDDVATEHILNMEKWGKLLSEVYENLQFPAVVSNENGHIVFEYAEGERLSDRLSQMLDNRDRFTEMMTAYLKELFEIKEDYIIPFKASDAFVRVFGDGSKLEGLDAATNCNADMILDNVFVAESNMTLIDNEWGFDFAVPVSFLKYRILFYFYRSYKHDLEKWFDFESFLSTFGVEAVYAETFANMERSFQEYVHGEKYLEQYVQSRTTISQIEEDLAITRVHLSHTENELNKTICEREDYRIGLENANIQLNLALKDNREKQQYINALEAIREENHIELDRIRYYKKHPVRRAYRICRRIGGKVYRKIKPILKKILPPTMYYKKLVIPRVESPMVSIVIPVYNEFDYTYKCIASIISNVKDVSYEIIIGDDESKDTTRKIKKIVKNLKVNINHSDHGFLMNCNRAAKLAEGKYIVFLNNDTLVKEEWLESLVNLIESDDKIGLVGSKLVYPDGRLQEAGGIVWKDATAWNYGRYQDPNLPEFNYVRDVDYISGASIMIAKKLWDEIGGFDEQFIPAYCEDTDLAFEVRKRGYRVVYQPKSVVVHFEGVSNGTDLDAGLKKYQVENQTKFYKKWCEELSRHNENGKNVFWARDQHQRRKTVLFVDHYVPTFDRDAGSRTVYQYIKIFVKKGYNVKFLGDNFNNMQPYTSALEQMGVEVLYGVWYSEHIFEWLAENKDYIDYAFLNRPHIASNYIDFLKEKTNIRLMYYGHDLHYLRAEREAIFSKDEKKLDESKYWKKVEYNIMHKVDAVYYLSHFEKDAILQEDPSINIKTIKVNIFEEFLRDINYDFNTREDLLFVGGFAHKPNVDAITWFVKEVFPIIKKSLDVNLLVVGSNAPDEVKALEGNGVIIKGFVSDEELEELYGNCRVAVVPLRYGAGIKGKVIEALYHGCPLVTTSVGAEGLPGIEQLVEVEDQPENFAEAVIRIYADLEKLKCCARACQDYVKSEYSIEAAWNIIKEDFE